MLLAAAALIKDSARTELLDRRRDDRRAALPALRRRADRGGAGRDREPRRPSRSTRWSRRPASRSMPEPAGGNGFTIERDVYTPDGELVDIATVGQNDRFVVVLTVTADHDYGGHIMVVDPIPAGFEIENPNISASRRHVVLRLAVDRHRQPHRGAHRPLRGGARPRRRRLDSSSASPTRCARCRRACSPSRRRRSRTCTGRSSTRAPATGTVEVVGPTR